MSKPKLEIEETDKGDLLVRLADEDTEYKQDFFRWLAMRGISVQDANLEFRLMGRVQIPFWMREQLGQSFRLVKVAA